MVGTGIGVAALLCELWGRVDVEVSAHRGWSCGGRYGVGVIRGCGELLGHQRGAARRLVAVRRQSLKDRCWLAFLRDLVVGGADWSQSPFDIHAGRVAAIRARSPADRRCRHISYLATSRG
jgi:hypothetical protein